MGCTTVESKGSGCLHVATVLTRIVTDVDSPRRSMPREGSGWSSNDASSWVVGSPIKRGRLLNRGLFRAILSWFPSAHTPFHHHDFVAPVLSILF